MKVLIQLSKNPMLLSGNGLVFYMHYGQIIHFSNNCQRKNIQQFYDFLVLIVLLLSGLITLGITHLLSDSNSAISLRGRVVMPSLMYNIFYLFSQSLYFDSLPQTSPPPSYLPSVITYLMSSLPLELSYLHFFSYKSMEKGHSKNPSLLYIIKS